MIKHSGSLSSTHQEYLPHLREDFSSTSLTPPHIQVAVTDHHVAKVKTFGYALALAILRLPSVLAAVEVIEIGPDAHIDLERGKINYTPDGSIFERPFRCPRNGKKVFAFNADKTIVTCCDPGQKLVGSKATEFHCCGAGHDLAGSKEVGYTCCPTGQIYDGETCHDKDPVCENGKVLFDGECVCPDGTIEDDEGNCEVDSDSDDDSETDTETECSSGIKTGKCCLFKMENGHFLGFKIVGWYTANENSRNHNLGKFKFCKDEKCTVGLPLDPGQKVHIKDLHGRANSGRDANQWLNNASNGGHIGKTPNFSSAGEFTITKWTSCKYCLGGFNHGLGPTCPSKDPAMTFNTNEKQSCLPVELVEVPCDIYAVENNCFWKKDPNCKNKNICPC